MGENDEMIEKLNCTIDFLNGIVSDLSNTNGECGSAYCFSLRLHYEELLVLQKIKIEELEAELQQYKAYVADVTTAIQKNICKDFCPNIEPVTKRKGGSQDAKERNS